MYDTWARGLNQKQMLRNDLLANATAPALLPHTVVPDGKNKEVVRAKRAGMKRERQLVLHTVKRGEKMPKENGKPKTLLGSDSIVAVSVPLSPRGKKAVQEKKENENDMTEKGEKEGRKIRPSRSGKFGSSGPIDVDESDCGSGRRRERTRRLSQKIKRHKNAGQR